MSGGERAAAHLELVFCSSDDERFPATNLTRPGGGQLTVWESEKFCEFPQELVFRVNRGLPTRIEQVNLLSHPFKVATRVEIFTSSAPSDGIHDGKTGMRFERLGHVRFKVGYDGNCGLSARETRLSRGIDPQYRCVRSFKDCWINAYSRHIRDTPPSKACRA
ncbi:hypothetical protein PF007_g16710 [Phytophthora fragariae]|uniref:Centrosomal protein CEP104 N-terminal domain-containing protein n=1 Tax=Phytophthora fragariae TaxID=53985 RepID=A0A6A3RJW1_9STRA|nr:hypothetical protein PF007_g16710 [Phytophthora fragariae]KAE9213040.1 hypothetical protein PF004_g15461 [Phytophthora fragariae]KAE9329222.1 hypothetical protein PF008_g15993 [Phytophthora fragariae]